VKKILASGSGRFLPRVGGAGGSKTPDEYEASKSLEQVVWWANTTTRKLTQMEGHMKEVARKLSCGPASVVEVLKEKLTAYNRLDNPQDQKEKDLKRIQELQKDVVRLNFKTGLLKKQVQVEKKRKEWK
jgi:hypothetical protein